MTPNDELARIRRFIANNSWKNAKTYEAFAPHEYIVKENVLDKFTFEWFVMYIREHGYPERFGKRTFMYLDVDGKKYWTMGSPLEKTIIINRAKI